MCTEIGGVHLAGLCPR